MDKYVNATKIIEKIDGELDLYRKEDGSLPETERVDELFRFLSVLNTAPSFPAAEFRPENAPPVTFRGRVIGMLKSMYFDNAEIVMFKNYLGFELKDGAVVAAELLPEPLENWEEIYEKTVRDSKEQ